MRVVVDSPPLDQDLCLEDGVEDLAAPELPVEGFHIAVLPGRAQLDEEGVDADAMEPITLQASVSYGRSDWALRCDADGTCELTQRWPEPVAQTFELSAEQRGELEQALEETQFFDLPPEISRPVPDGTVRTLTVTCGDQSHTVTINFVPNITDPNEREAAQRALQIWHLVRGWFDDAAIPDLRPYDCQWLERWAPEESEAEPSSMEATDQPQPL